MPSTKSSSSKSTANIITDLRAEHREVARMFEVLEKTTARATRKRQDLFAELDQALSVHAEFEEVHVYPLLTARKSSKDLSLEAFEEHAQIKHLLRELRELDPQHERWMAKLTVLMEDVRHHVKEEEGELFPELRKACGSKELAGLAQEYADYRRSDAAKNVRDFDDLDSALSANVDSGSSGSEAR